jgi:hypothetical protein
MYIDLTKPKKYYFHLLPITEFDAQVPRYDVMALFFIR